MDACLFIDRYYHFGVVKAHLDAGLLPNIITGTSGGALVAALACTRTDEELKQLLVPALAAKITACHDDTWVLNYCSLRNFRRMRVANGDSQDVDPPLVDNWGSL